MTLNCEVIGIETDRLGREVVVKHSASLGYNPAYTFFLREMANLIDNRHCSDFTWWKDTDCGIIWVEIQGKIAGIYSYNREFLNSPSPFLAILLISVDSEFRQSGLYEIMHRYFEDRAKQLGVRFIRAMIHVDNKIRQITAQRSQLRKTEILYKYTIRNQGETAASLKHKLAESLFYPEMCKFMDTNRQRLLELGTVESRAGHLTKLTEDLSSLEKDNDYLIFNNHSSNKIVQQLLSPESPELFTEFEKYTAARGYVQISEAVAYSDKSRQEYLESLGFKPEYYFMFKRV